MANLRVSVIVEGDNEKHCPQGEDGPICLGLEGLLDQDFPLDQVDLLLVGGEAQIARWNTEAITRAFGRVRTIPADEVDYFEMKQRGLAEAVCPLLAFVDSDVRPGLQWLSTLVRTLESGNAVAVGLTQFEWHGKYGPDSALMLAFGSISWGAILGPHGVLGFHANNVGFRAELLELASQRSGLLRACAAQELFRSWMANGRKAAFRKEQQVVHAFSFDWWADMHGRSGRESMLMRRMFPDWPHQWVTRTGPLEPVLTALWRIVLDPGQWWRYAGAAGVSGFRRLMLMPLMLAVSVATRGAEMYGGYKGLLDGSMAVEKAAHLNAKS